MPKEASDVILTSTADIKASYDSTTAVQVGQTLPEFTLSDATGKQVSSASLLAKGPLLISFYRGEWCPYCNLELRALQKVLPQFEAKGVTFVAISPELPDTSLSTVRSPSFATVSFLAGPYLHRNRTTNSLS
jgi:peroxiredoxin